MLTKDQQISRRVGRMEALASDLAGLQPGYQPTELELSRVAELRAYLDVVFGSVQAEPAPEVPAPAPAEAEAPSAPGMPGKKAKK